jgi:hypothetical protein
MSDPASNTTRPLRRVEAAAYIRDKFNFPCEASSLRTMACRGSGPEFRKGSRFPLYDPADLDAWAQSKLSPKVRSTSELTALRAASPSPRVSWRSSTREPPTQKEAPRRGQPRGAKDFFRCLDNIQPRGLRGKE